MPDNEQLRIKEYDQAMSILDLARGKVERGEVVSMLMLCEMADGTMEGCTTATQNQFAVAGYMVTWALRRLGFTQFDDVRMMLP
jgi:hypothetical protein